MSLLPKNIEPQERAVTDLSKGFVPAVNVYQKDKNVVVETAVPGVDPKDVEVTVKDNVLTIRGKSEHSTEVDEKDYYYKEMRYGAFQRRIELPVPVLGEKAETKSEHGLLKITIPLEKK